MESVQVWAQTRFLPEHSVRVINEKAAKVAGNSLFLGAIIYAACLLFWNIRCQSIYFISDIR